MHVGKPHAAAPHVQESTEWLTRMGMLDMGAGAATSGMGFVFLRGDAALLETALVQYAMQKASQLGYTATVTPDVVRTEVFKGCGYNPRSDATQVYRLHKKHGDACLVGTSEIALCGLFGNALLSEIDLPIKASFPSLSLSLSGFLTSFTSTSPSLCVCMSMYVCACVYVRVCMSVRVRVKAQES